MPIDAWLPVGYVLPGGMKVLRVLLAADSWQIFDADHEGRALIAAESLGRRWIDTGLIDPANLMAFTFGDRALFSLSSSSAHVLAPVSGGRSPDTKNEALAFSHALRETRLIERQASLHDALYVERYSRLLPTYSISAHVGDDVVLGLWLTGGAPVSANAPRRLRQIVSWLGTQQLTDVVLAAGIDAGIQNVVEKTPASPNTETQAFATSRISSGGPFQLPGRPALENFFNEHVVDILRNRDRYRAFGIGFPGAIALHGPPGGGKTFAVDRLIDFLEWPSFRIEASSVASPYIHETSRKVADVFEQAMKASPAVLVIDEMEAFLTNRDQADGQHRVEEVAEFLRRIPEAAKNDVLLIGMTNRIELIDPAILRRGRFDHLIEVGYASAVEVRALLDHLLSTIPRDEDVDPAPLAAHLQGRSLADVGFVVREGARLAARAGRDRLDQASLVQALTSAPSRERDPPRKIGFV